MSAQQPAGEGHGEAIYNLSQEDHSHTLSGQSTMDKGTAAQEARRYWQQKWIDIMLHGLSSGCVTEQT